MSPSTQSLLALYPVITPIPVQWGDMDAAQHVNNVVYLRWVESARMDYFTRVDFEDFSGKEVGPILGAVHCKYIFPLVYPDRVFLGTRAKDFQADRFTLETAIVSERHERLAALAEAVIIPYDYENRKKAGLPHELVSRIRQLEGMTQD
jgi:acyl-CoA thioester hydrolase